MSGLSEIRETIAALETRRVELEALIFQDLERRFFSESGPISAIRTNPVGASDAYSADSGTVNMSCAASSHSNGSRNVSSGS